MRVALDLADVLTWLGDLDRALSSYQVAADLARSASDPVLRARAEIGANLYASAFVPDLPRMRRLEDALRTLPPDERHLRATLLGRLTIVGRADVDATDQVRAWAYLGGRGHQQRPGRRRLGRHDVRLPVRGRSTSVNPSLWRRSSLPPVAPAHSALSTRRRRIGSALEVHVDENARTRLRR